MIQTRILLEDLVTVTVTEIAEKHAIIAIDIPYLTPKGMAIARAFRTREAKILQDFPNLIIKCNGDSPIKIYVPQKYYSSEQDNKQTIVDQLYDLIETVEPIALIDQQAYTQC